MVKGLVNSTSPFIFRENNIAFYEEILKGGFYYDN